MVTVLSGDLVLNTGAGEIQPRFVRASLDVSVYVVMLGNVGAGGRTFGATLDRDWHSWSTTHVTSRFWQLCVRHRETTSSSPTRRRLPHTRISALPYHVEYIHHVHHLGRIKGAP
jgi:hypothetical protein